MTTGDSIGRSRMLPPLPERMRPHDLDGYVGQRHLIGQGCILRNMIESGNLSSFILWGPPGVGKTTLSHIVAKSLGREFFTLSAVSSGVKDVRDVIDRARSNSLFASGSSPILFIDEIHRFNKAQQDVLLPHLERGTVRFIGATTENPFFAINSAMLSRSQIFPLEPVKDSDIVELLRRAMTDAERGLGNLAVDVAEDALAHLALKADGDVRKALTALEVAVLSTPVGNDGVIHVDLSVAEESIQKKAVKYDRAGDGHYDTISAFIKSYNVSNCQSAHNFNPKLFSGNYLL